MLSKSPIKAFAKVGAGQGAPQKETDFSNEGYPFIRAGHLEDLLGGKDEMDLPKVNSKIASIYRLKLYQPNTIIFAKSGMSAMKGRIYKLRNPCYVVNHLATLELSEKAFPDFVVYTLRHFSPVRLINDSSYPSLKQSTIDAYEIPFPKEISYQIRIAEILNKSENLISQRKESIRLLDEYLKSTFIEKFIDKNYPLEKLENLCIKITDGEHLKPNYIEDGFPFISVVNISRGFLSFENCKYISGNDFIKFTRRCKPELNDIIYTKVGATYGRAVLVDTERPFSLYVSVALIKPFKEKVNSKFLQFVINHPFVKRQADKSIKGAGVPDLHLIEIKSFKIPMPPRELQDEFAHVVKKTEALKDKYKSSLQLLENLYGSLSQRAFRGELSFKEEGLMIAAEPNESYSVRLLENLSK